MPGSTAAGMLARWAREVIVDPDATIVRAALLCVDGAIGKRG